MRAFCDFVIYCLPRGCGKNNIFGNIGNEGKFFKLKMEDEKSKPKKEPQERRSGQGRRKFAYGPQGRERRKNFGRRKEDKPSD